MHYEELVDDALRGVVRRTLSRVAASGLPGNHHLYLSFRSHHPGVHVPDRLRQEHPEEITIVLQHQFWGLSVEENGFQVTLSFNGVQEPLSVPFAAVTGFVDPSVRFGLQFRAAGERSPSSSGDATTAGAESGETMGTESTAADGKKIVTLDRFRRK